jgi:hypothetical protein
LAWDKGAEFAPVKNWPEIDKKGVMTAKFIGDDGRMNGNEPKERDAITARTIVQLAQGSVNELPEYDEKVIVITPDFRCLGRLGRDGKWYSVYRPDPLPNVMAWARLEGSSPPSIQRGC